jgi:hypothetical protein
MGSIGSDVTIWAAKFWHKLEWDAGKVIWAAGPTKRGYRLWSASRGVHLQPTLKHPLSGLELRSMGHRPGVIAILTCWLLTSQAAILPWGNPAPFSPKFYTMPFFQEIKILEPVLDLLSSYFFLFIELFMTSDLSSSGYFESHLFIHSTSVFWELGVVVIVVVVLGTELMDSCLLGSTLPLKPHPQSFCFNYFSDTVSFFCPGGPWTKICLRLPPG